MCLHVIVRVYSLKKGKKIHIYLWCDHMINQQMRNYFFTWQSHLDVYLAQSPTGASVQHMQPWAQVHASCS